MNPLKTWLRRKSVLSIAASLALASTLALTATLFLTGTPAHATSASFTTVNESVDGTGHCQNGNPDVNCNIYDGKQFVWMNGGPVGAALGDGTYFFAVLDPGGQGGNQNPNDGTPKNLSSPNDAYTNRTFSVSGGIVSYSGTHDFDSNKIRLMPYNDTSNPGGVYILAVCSLAKADPNAANPPGVNPSDCKYDAFKVNTGANIGPLTVTKDAAGSYKTTFAWDIHKDVDQTKVVSSAGSATFTYTVTVTHDSGTDSNIQVTGTIQVFNPNTDASNTILAVSGVDVTDQLSDNTVCSVDNGLNQTLTTFETDFTYTCNLSSVPQGQLDNTVTVTWPDQTLSDGSSLAGGTATFIFSSIAFTQTKVDDCVAVTDTLGGTLGTVCSTDPSPTLFTYQHTVPGTPGTCVTQDNTAMFTTNTTGSTGSASQSVQFCEGADLQVTKNATPGFNRTYTWTISKSADKTLIEQIGGTATVTYTVTVKQTGYVDSGWQANGSITVTNPNAFEDIVANVTDAVDNGGSCAVTGGTGVTIPAGKSVMLSYSCTYASQPAYGTLVTNTATATWDASAAGTPHGSAQGQATFKFNTGSSGNPTEINKCVTITDSFAGTLGTDCVGTDSATKTFTYQRTFTIPTNNCVTYPNTATIKETGQSAGASVEVCGPAKTGALTMGFWQNKNGQGIISGGASTSGVCNSGTWLRQFKPFQDLSSTATCAQVATYVFNIIKGAGSTCSGTCYTMLKAQMLATALNVYFSDPTLGGNKINAPAPIGGVAIDLTKICAMIDSSSGGSCSGKFENVSSAFGGASSLTVLQMLTYAAGQSNVGGTSWYGGSKTLVVYAKDAFDAINNQIAFAP